MKESLPTHRKRLESSTHRPLQIVGIVLSIVVLVVSALGLVYLQKPLKKSQIVVSEASVDTGLASIAARLNSDQFIQGQPNTVTLSVDTAGATLHGIQLVFNIITDTANDVTVNVLKSSGLEPEFLEVERTSDGFLVGVVAFPPITQNGFAASTPLDFLEISVTPQQGGTITLNFDADESFGSLFGSEPPKDELTHIPSISFSVAGVRGQAPPEDSTTAGESGDIETEAQSNDRAADQSIPEGCNTVCSNNAACPINHRCVAIDDGSSRCRLATNITSEMCTTKLASQTNAPLASISPISSSSCNRSCILNSQCADGTICFQGNCRNPATPDSTSCQVPNESEQEALAESCGNTCITDAECSTHLRCMSGTCRLASNVSSTTCASGTAGIVSTIYERKSAGNTGAGGETQLPVINEQTNNSTDASLTTLAPGEETAWDMVVAMLESKDLSLAVLTLFAGALLLVLALGWVVYKYIRERKLRPRAPVPTIIDRTAEEISTSTFSSSPSTSQSIQSGVQRPTAQSAMMERIREKGVSLEHPTTNAK